MDDKLHENKLCEAVSNCLKCKKQKWQIGLFWHNPNCELNDIFLGKIDTQSPSDWYLI